MEVFICYGDVEKECFVCGDGGVCCVFFGRLVFVVVNDDVGCYVIFV